MVGRTYRLSPVIDPPSDLRPRLFETQGDRIMRLLISGLIAASLVIAAAAPADAVVRKYNGGSTVITTNRTTRTTLIDRTPARAKVVVMLQKKAGRTKCRLNSVSFARAGRSYRVGPYEKWARTYNRAGVWSFPVTRRDRTIGVTIRTNGRCVVGVSIR